MDGSAPIAHKPQPRPRTLSWTRACVIAFGIVALLAVIGLVTRLPRAGRHLVGEVACGRGYKSYLAGDYKEAERSARDAIAAFPTDGAFYFLLGDSLSAQKRQLEAVVAYRTGARLSPDMRGLQLRLGDGLYDLGQYEEAIGAYKAYSRLDPQSGVIRGKIGDALTELYRLPAAEREYRKAVRLEPNEALLWDRLGAEVHERAVLSGDDAKIAEAVGYYRKALKLDPTLSDPHYGMGLALWDLRGDPPDHVKLQDAEAELREAIRLDKSYVLPKYRLSLVLRALGKGREADSMYSDALSAGKAPTWVDHWRMGHRLRKDQRYQDALVEYRRALALTEPDAQGHRYDEAACCNEMGFCLRRLRKLDEAILMQRRAVSLAPTLYYRAPLAGALMDAGRHVEAEKQYRAALKEYPGSAPARRGLVKALEKQGKHKQAGGVRKEGERLDAKATAWH